MKEAEENISVAKKQPIPQDNQLIEIAIALAHQNGVTHERKVHVMITAFRDGFQSCFGARVFTKDFLPALEAAADAGFTHFEAGGGARYQVPYLYCGENAFDMMDSFRATVGPDANLQTLARGVNVVGLDSQSSDIIDLHAKMFKTWDDYNP